MYISPFGHVLSCQKCAVAIVGISNRWKNSELQSVVSRVYSQCRQLHDLRCSASTLHSPRGDGCLFDITALSFICPWMRDLAEGTHNIWMCLLILQTKSSRWTVIFHRMFRPWVALSEKIFNLFVKFNQGEISRHCFELFWSESAWHDRMVFINKCHL